MNTITNEQIKEAYERPELLKELFPNAFKPVLEVGKWYLITEGSCTALFNFSGQFDRDNDPLGYGFDYNGNWWDLDGSGWGYDTIRPATPEEVEKALINEAVNRGFEKGVKIKWDGYTGVVKGDIYWAESSECISVEVEQNSTKRPNYFFPIMLDGKWAEIIQETEIELTLEQIAKKFGVDKVKIKP